MPDKSLADAADYFYSACDLWEDEDLDPEDSLEVLKRAFRSSDCDDFASVLSRVTGWPVTTMTWQIAGYGFGHHAMVRSPDGQLLDVGGWTDEKQLRKSFGVKADEPVGWTDGHISSPMYDDGDEAVELIETVIANLPYEPFSSNRFISNAATSPSA